MCRLRARMKSSPGEGCWCPRRTVALRWISGYLAVFVHAARSMLLTCARSLIRIRHRWRMTLIFEGLLNVARWASLSLISLTAVPLLRRCCTSSNCSFTSSIRRLTCANCSLTGKPRRRLPSSTQCCARRRIPSCVSVNGRATNRDTSAVRAYNLQCRYSGER